MICCFNLNQPEDLQFIPRIWLDDTSFGVVSPV